jgi:Cys-tRNA(Pro) deacylase
VTGRVRTAATRALDAAGVPFEPCSYAYVERGGTGHAAEALGVDERAVVKTLVFDAGARGPVLVLMRGDKRVSTKALARALGVRRVVPCSPSDVTRITGYVVGGVSPFGARRPIPVLIERSVLDVDTIWLNGGRRGLLVAVDPVAAARALGAREVDVAAG